LKIVHFERLLHVGPFASSAEWQNIRAGLITAVQAVDWPPGSGKFTIHPESGKERGKGNGVVPIKKDLMADLKRQQWKLEDPFHVIPGKLPGKFDAAFYSPHGRIILEWESGNISSSHRALNKMSLGLLRGSIAAAVLVIPSRPFAYYLTGRIGNFPELEPYVDLWKSLPVTDGVLEIFVIEHDATSTSVPKIPKGKDGRALE